MSAVDEIEAAIAKLTEIKRHSGDVVAGADPGYVYFRTDDDIDDDGESFSFGDGVDLGETDYVQGVVTLHHTIDAQLAILTQARDLILAWIDPDSDLGWEEHDGDHPESARHYLALARSINGVTS